MAKQYTACVIGRLVTELDEPYRAKVEELVNSKHSADAIAVALHDMNLTGSATAIRLHRRKQCACQLRGNK